MARRRLALMTGSRVRRDLAAAMRRKTSRWRRTKVINEPVSHARSTRPETIAKVIQEIT